MNLFLKFFTCICTIVGSDIGWGEPSYPCKAECVDLKETSNENYDAKYFTQEYSLGDCLTSSIYRHGDGTIKRIETDDDEIIEAAYQEIEILKAHKIDGIAKYQECAFDNDYFYLKYQKLYGLMSRPNILEEFGGLETRKKLEAYNKLVATVNKIHLNNLVHGNIKPNNMMANDATFSQIVLINFDLAHYTKQKYRGGSLLYQSPDFLLNQESDPIANDLWALALSILEIQFGEDIFDDKVTDCLEEIGNARNDPSKSSTDIEWQEKVRNYRKFLEVSVSEAFTRQKSRIVNDCGQDTYDILSTLFKNIINPENSSKSPNLSKKLTQAINNCKAPESKQKVNGNLKIKSDCVESKKDKSTTKLCKVKETIRRQLPIILEKPAALEEDPEEKATVEYKFSNLKEAENSIEDSLNILASEIKNIGPLSKDENLLAAKETIVKMYPVSTESESDNVGSGPKPIVRKQAIKKAQQPPDFNTELQNTKNLVAILKELSIEIKTGLKKLITTEIREVASTRFRRTNTAFEVYSYKLKVWNILFARSILKSLNGYKDII